MLSEVRLEQYSGGDAYCKFDSSWITDLKCMSSNNYTKVIHLMSEKNQIKAQVISRFYLWSQIAITPKCQWMSE